MSTKAILLFLLLSVGEVWATACGQEVRLDFTIRNKSLIEVMDQLKQKTGISFLYSASEVEKFRDITVEVKNKSVREILDAALAGTGLSYTAEENLFILKRGVPDATPQAEKTLSGVICDLEKKPLPGVTVMIKGTTTGVISDREGMYRLPLSALAGNPVIRFTFIGKAAREVKYTGQDRLDIVMQDEATEMEEVVITGYQTMDKRYSTSAITTLKMDDILLPGMTTVDKMLEGNVPGMIFMQNSAQVGATPRLRIRGTSTILGNQEPLWVVDGIVQQDPVNLSPEQINDLDFVNLLGNAISGLNPNDIEQIDILKDASATALYGARAANGVIVITTKKGEMGPPRLGYNFSATYSRRPRYSDKEVNMMNSAERIDYSREVIEKGITYNSSNALVGYEGAWADYTSGRIPFSEFQQRVSYYETLNTDWFDLICQDVFSHNHTLSVSGGANAFKYYASLGYNRENGVLKEEYGERYNASIRITASHKKLTAQFGLSGNIYDRQYTPSDVNLLNYAYNTTRAVEAFNPDGGYWYYKRNSANGQDIPFNILNERKHSKDNMKNNALSFTTSINYRFTEALRAEATLAYSTSQMNRQIYRGEKTFYAANLRYENNPNQDLMNQLPVGGELIEENTGNRAYTIRFQLNYNKFLDDDRRHMLATAAGGEISSSHYTGGGKTYRGYVPERGLLLSSVPLEEYPGYATWLSTNPAALGSRKDQLTNMASTYGTVSYSYDNRYVVNANIRIDGSNKFGTKANDKLLPIWSVSGLWHIKEDILRQVTWVNRLSLRASLGFQGNMLDHETPELIIKQAGMHPLFKEYYATVYAYPNPYLNWEKTRSLNTSLDFAFLNNKIRGTFGYYYKKTTDAFLKKKVSVINGVSEYSVNQGTIENQGFEIQLHIIPVSSFGADGKGFRWTLDPQIGQVVNKLLNKAIESKKQVLHDKYTYRDYLSGKVQVSGKPLNSFYSYRYEGLSAEDGRPLFGGIGQEEMEAVYDGMETEEVFFSVMEHSGNRVPVLQGGIRNTFSYKNWVLGINLTYSLGSKIRLLQLYGTSTAQTAKNPEDNMRREFVNRWRHTGDEAATDIPGILSNEAYKNTVNNYWWRSKPYVFADNIWNMYDHGNHRVVSGNYLKLQDLSFRYVVPDEWCRKLYVNSAYLNFSGTNLFVWSAKVLKGQDPVTQSGSTESINLSLRPSYTLTLNLSF